MLLSLGANPDIKNDYGITPLAYAAWRPGEGTRNYPETIRLLLKADADPDSKDNEGRIALPWSSRWRYFFTLLFR